MLESSFHTPREGFATKYEGQGGSRSKMSPNRFIGLKLKVMRISRTYFCQVRGRPMGEQLCEYSRNNEDYQDLS